MGGDVGEGGSGEQCDSDSPAVGGTPLPSSAGRQREDVNESSMFEVRGPASLVLLAFGASTTRTTRTTRRAGFSCEGFGRGGGNGC